MIGGGYCQSPIRWEFNANELGLQTNTQWAVCCQYAGEQHTNEAPFECGISGIDCTNYLVGMGKFYMGIHVQFHP